MMAKTTVKSMTKELLMYTRTAGCPFVTVAKKVLSDYQVPYREIFIDRDPQARERLLEWVGFLSVPTLVVAERGQDTPMTEPTYLEKGYSPRGIDRGSMLTEGNAVQLTAWLTRHGFIEPEA
jgi:glutaredoxin